MIPGRRVLRRSTAALAAAVLIVGLGALPVSAATKTPSTLYGVHSAGIAQGIWAPGSARVGAVRIWDSGAAWGQVETARGTYDWTVLDAAVAQARSRGSQVLYVLGSTPTWASSSPSSPGYLYPGSTAMPSSTTDWQNWVREVATRYKGRISAYQIWNEANLSTFWTGSPAQMATLTKLAADIVHSVDPSASVVAASTTTRLRKDFRQFFPAYLKALKKKKWPVDVFSGHFYPTSTGTPADRVGYIATFQTDLRKAKAPARPVWETEINYGLAGPGAAFPKQDITGSTAQAYVAQTYLDSLRLGVARSYWFAWTTAPDALFGIQMVTGQPAAEAWTVVSGWTVGKPWRGCTTSGSVVSCLVGKKSSGATIVWTSSGKAKVRAPSGATQACALATCTPVRGGSKVKVGVVPVRFDA